MAEVIATMLDEKNIDEVLDEDENTSNWKSHILEQLYNFGDVFFKQKSERIPVCKTYDHPINFVEGASLPKPAKLYPLSPKE